MRPTSDKVTSSGSCELVKRRGKNEDISRVFHVVASDASRRALSCVGVQR